MSEPEGRKRGLPERVKMRHDSHFVDDLTSREVEPIGRMMPLSLIEPDPGQPRSEMGDLEELTASVLEKGVLEPILVRPHGANSGPDETFWIVSGERRYQAALKAGLYDVPVIEMDLDDEEALEIALVENLQRKDLTPFEEGEGYRRLADHFGYKHDQIAGAVGKSRSVVTESLTLLQIPARARTVAVALDVLSKSVLLEVLKASGDDEDEMVTLLEQVANEGLTRDDLREAARARKEAATARGGSRRRKPYVFRFKSPDKTYNLALTFRKSTVDRDDLIQALEQILTQLQEAKE
ncbi:MAG: ParB/RepB/Spo0J family partition protein [Thermoanaerobaculia bacterium]